MSIGAAPGRLAALDIARTAALAGMAVFHLAYDLELFGHLAPGTTGHGPWRWFAMLVAGSFLFLAGVSLHLAHAERIRWRAFWRRFAKIAAAAGLVSAGTYAVFPQSFVYFGILHAIAASSLVGLAFLRLPAAATLAAAVAALVIPSLWRLPAFDTPWLWWTGLSPSVRPTMDFEPMLPWVAPFLAGLALARILRLHTRPRRRTGPVLAALAWPGRWSLVIYLVHQPVLIGLVWAGTELGR